MRGRNSSADLGPGLRERRRRALLPVQQFWPKAINPGGLEAEPPVQKKISFRLFVTPLPCRLADAVCRVAAAPAAAGDR